MVPFLLILIPVFGGCLLFFLKSQQNAKNVALVFAVLGAVVSVTGLLLAKNSPALAFNAEWMPALGSRFRIELDGMGQLMCLLTAVSFPLIFTATYENNYEDANRFYGLMLLSQAGLMG